VSESSSTAKASVAPKQSRRWWWVAFFLCWTVLASAAICWLMNGANAEKNTVIRIGPDEVKSWSARLHETIALIRLNAPWALVWVFLAPYVLWVGVRFSFENARWLSRLAVLLGAGTAFIFGSQWLSARLAAGQTMVVMMNFQAGTTVGKGPKVVHWLDEPTVEVVTNRVVSNHFTKVMVAGGASFPAGAGDWETTARGMMSNLPTNLPPMFTRRLTDLPRPGSSKIGRWSAALDGLAYVALIGLAHAGVFHRRYREREQQAALLASRLTDARLRALQAQLQPHFLFNSLNGIATLLRRDPAKAEEMLVSLSELLRIALSSSNRQEIPLREEMDFLGRYLAIQKMRFGERLQVTEEIEPAAMDCLVPALLLQPLVENAIRHGLEPSGREGNLRIAASRNGEWLKLTIEDNGVGLRAGENNRNGVGLTNVRERLATLHGSAHEFDLAERQGGGVVVNVCLPIRTETPAQGQGSAA
jgi:anti-sigma regulatory factor (Ser/Thr protein kinase)